MARWIAIEKLREANDVPASVVATLREVAERDDFIRLRSWEPGDDTETYRSNDPEAEGTVFVARLRNGARALLARMGVALGPLDEQQLGREGLRWLAQLYLAEGNTERDRMRVAGALAGLSPRTPEIARSKRRAWPSEEPARIRAFFEDLSNGRFPPVNGNAGSNRRSVEGGSAPAKAATAAKKAPTDVDKPSRQDSPREWGQLVGVLAIAVVAVVVLLGLRARQRARDDSKRDKV
ncbi:MAG: hypothetical protein FJ399_15325 [Verrucomicrobia bacterium]|nr:hypothetical protein [Verrucomicrobiota bacterium]